MITSIEFTESGIAKFNAFMQSTAKPEVRTEAVMWEALDILADRASNGEAMTYELGRRYTLSGNPALFTITADDYMVELIS